MSRRYDPGKAYWETARGYNEELRQSLQAKGKGGIQAWQANSPRGPRDAVYNSMRLFGGQLWDRTQLLIVNNQADSGASVSEAFTASLRKGHELLRAAIYTPELALGPDIEQMSARVDVGYAISKLLSTSTGAPSDHEFFLAELERGASHAFDINPSGE